jgi:hypothetical protein
VPAYPRETEETLLNATLDNTAFDERHFGITKELPSFAGIASSKQH